MTIKYDIATVIGRLQIAHLGHEDLIRQGLSLARKVVVVLGSSLRPRDSRNPFTWEERRAMIEGAFAPTERERISFVPVCDYFDDNRWDQAVRNRVLACSDIPNPSVILVGHKKDHTSYYLDHFQGWARYEVTPKYDIDATSLRDVYFEGEDPAARLAVLKPYVSSGVLSYLQVWSMLPAYAERAAEHRRVKANHKKYGPGPFLTADAVIEVSECILMGRRGFDDQGNPAIGHGAWAFPGGFLNPGERFYDGALRELDEETGLRLLPSTMEAAFRGTLLLDHPARSPRARLISVAHHWNLGNMALPELRCASDLMEVAFIPKKDLASLAPHIFEDHACALDRLFGGVLPAP